MFMCATVGTTVLRDMGNEHSVFCVHWKEKHQQQQQAEFMKHILRIEFRFSSFQNLLHFMFNSVENFIWPSWWKERTGYIYELFLL